MGRINQATYGRVWWATRYLLFAMVGATAGLAAAIVAHDAGVLTR